MPEEGDDVTISGPVLLDLATPRLGAVKIENNGSLVFKPNFKIKAMLTAESIYIDDGGRLDIGHNNCRFTYEAEILLTGKNIHAFY